MSSERRQQKINSNEDLSDASGQNYSTPKEYESVIRLTDAFVLKKGEVAGTLSRKKDGTEFRYNAEYLAAAKEPIAHSLPLTEQVVRTPAGAVPAFFTGLLPEGRRLSYLKRSIKTSADNELALLLAVGTDLVGDVQVLNCIVGKRGGMLEDCGGIGMFNMLVEQHKTGEYEDGEMADWIPEEWDPQDFDIDDINEQLQNILITKSKKSGKPKYSIQKVGFLDLIRM